MGTGNSRGASEAAWAFALGAGERGAPSAPWEPRHQHSRLHTCSWPSGLRFSQRPPDLSQASGVPTAVTVRKLCPRGVTACPSPKATRQLGSGLFLLCP